MWRSDPIPIDLIAAPQRAGAVPEVASDQCVLQTLDLKKSCRPTHLKIIGSSGAAVPQADGAYNGIRDLVQRNCIST